MAGRGLDDALTRARIQRAALLCLSVVSLCLLPGLARAQDATPEEGALPALPAPTLEEPPPGPPEPLPEPEEEEQPEILHRISVGDHPEWEIEDGEEAPHDISFEVPGDARTQSQSNQIRLPQQEDPIAPPTFGIGAGAGFARLLGAIAFDYFLLNQRFEARIPDFPALHLGAAASEMFNDTDYLVGGGARIGLGATWCDAGWVVCEGIATIQPGVMGGPMLGVRFDLHAELDLRFHFRGLLELGVVGGYSLLGETSLLQVGGEAAIVF